MTPDEPLERRLTPEYLDGQRPLLLRGCILFGALTGFGLLLFGWDLIQVSASPAAALLVLGVVFGASILGAFLLGRMRARTIRAGRDGRVIRSPSWLGAALAIIPGFVIVASHGLGQISASASDLTGLLGAYLMGLGFGAMLGLLTTT